jgi:selenide, water dikinase
LLVGIATGDDAGVYRLAPDLAIVNTVDFFTPVVDDPYTYGQISAANALSDVYAMGGVPRTALNIVCWPQSGLPHSMLADILRGGIDKVREAGAVIVGGHTVADDEVKYGMAVTGVIDPRRIVRNVGARAGDLLVLSKPLGTGVLMTAFKRDALAADHYAAAVRAMSQLNRAAAEAMLRHGAHAATDITGFGLMGHAFKMAEGSNVTLVFEESDLPLLPGALEQARARMIPGGGTRNREYYAPHVRISEEVAEEMTTLAFDPQTSGGLLIAVSEAEATPLLAELQGSGHPDAAIVGRATRRAERPLELV